MTQGLRRCQVKWMPWLIVLFAFNAWPTPVAEEQPSDPEQLLGVVRSCFEQRANAVASSRGRAHLALEVTRPAEAEKALLEKISKQTGVAPEKLHGSGVAEWYVDWWRKGAKNRYDTSPDDNGVTRGYLKPERMRKAVDAESSIYYQVDRNRAYINHPPAKDMNPLAMMSYFDPEFLYEYGGRNVPWLIQKYLSDNNYKIDGVTTATINDIHCVGLVFRRQDPCRSGRTQKKEYSFWFAPEMAYSLVKGEIKGTVAFDTEIGEAFVLGAYDAKYAESEETPGVWLIKELCVIEREMRQKEEKLKVTVEEAHAGVEISDEVFTFAGMGVPEGAMFFDMRLDAREPVITSYSSDMKIGLENTHVETPPSPVADPPAPPAETTPPAESPQKAENPFHVMYVSGLLLAVSVLVFCVYRLKRRLSGR